MTVFAGTPVSTESLRPDRPGTEQRLLLHNIGWQTYEAIGKALQDRSNVRLTYDGEALEIVTLSPEHEKLRHRLGRFLEVLAEELDLTLEPGGSMTFKREDLARGLEPDECFWIANEPQVRGKVEWDPNRDPSPDLVIEIEITRSALDRRDIYAALGLPEVWRCTRESLIVLRIQDDGNYQVSEASPTFPGIPVVEMVRFLQPDETRDYLSLVRSFRAWVRDQLAQR
jgi:Uma2 family endonuclease